MLIKVVPSVNRLTDHDDTPVPETEKNFVYLRFRLYIVFLFPF